MDGQRAELSPSPTEAVFDFFPFGIGGGKIRWAARTASSGWVPCIGDSVGSFVYDWSN